MTGENYTNTFGGENVSPANLSYVSYAISSDIALVWAFEAVQGDLVTADKIDINCEGHNFKVAMPPANQVTVGQDVLFGGIGVFPFVVTDNGGNTICTVPSGVEWFIYLTDNSTVNGVWRSVQFGATSSAGNSAALAGAGLRANATVLDQNLPTTTLTSSYTATAADRATVLENTGGTVVYTLPNAGDVGNGWFVYVINSGSGNLTLTAVGGQTIDSSSGTKAMAPGETLILFCDGANFHSIGYNALSSSGITARSINVPGTGTYVLSGSEVQAQIQDFTGTLTGPKVVQYGSGIGYWFVYNFTTGSTTGPPPAPYPLTAIALGGAGDPGALIPQNAYSILRSNGSSMEVAFSGAVGTVSSILTTTDLTGGPITSTGTLGMSNTGVLAGTYGDASHAAAIQLDIKGRAVAATAPSIAIVGSQVTNLGNYIPTGAILPWAAPGPPPSLWLICDGTIYDTTGHPEWMLLLATIHNTYGGNGTTTFGVPDLRGRTISGMDSGTGRLRNAYFPGGADSNTIGSGGGTDANAANINIPQLFLRIGYWASPAQSSTAYGTTTISVSGTTGTESSDVTNLQFGGSGIAAETHTHAWSGTFSGGLSWAPASFGAYGLSDAIYNTAAPSVNGTTYFSVVQPTLIMRWIIKT